MNFSKRRRDEVEPDLKKTKNLVNEKEHLEFTSLNEWPVYNHPEGGIVKITPWGSLRQYPNPVNGEMVTKFEDISFLDYLFESPHTANVYDNVVLPQTPQSIYPGSDSISRCDSLSPSHAPDRIRITPSDETELYVMDGYQQEHENYFGMEEMEAKVEDAEMC